MTTTITPSPYSTAIREICIRCSDPCFRCFPCLSDPGKRSSLGLKVALVLLHGIFIGSLFILDSDLIRTTQQRPWYTAIYLVLFVLTLAQYFITSGSSPGYVIDAMKAESETHSTVINVSKASVQSASKYERLNSSSNNHANPSSWQRLLMDLYPPGTLSRQWTCTYCNIIQPPRSKHCHDCDKCVLQFDHHCIWIGTCIGRGNHCRFWWYIFEETLLCIWTGVLYIAFLISKAEKEWLSVFLIIVLLTALVFCFVFLLLLLLFHSFLIVTNQTTYELVRRRRIQYLRDIPARVQPFSKGFCKNIYSFCCSKESIYTLEAIPTMEELDARAKPNTCLDIISCRCS